MLQKCGKSQGKPNHRPIPASFYEGVPAPESAFLMRITIPTETKQQYKAVTIPMINAELTINQLVIGMIIFAFGMKIASTPLPKPASAALIILYFLVSGVLLVGKWPLFHQNADSFYLWAKRIVMYLMRPRIWLYR